VLYAQPQQRCHGSSAAEALPRQRRMGSANAAVSPWYRARQRRCDRFALVASPLPRCRDSAACFKVPASSFFNASLGPVGAIVIPATETLPYVTSSTALAHQPSRNTPPRPHSFLKDTLTSGSCYGHLFFTPGCMVMYYSKKKLEK
jgi:hypothetical protein